MDTYIAWQIQFTSRDVFPGIWYPMFTTYSLLVSVIYKRTSPGKYLVCCSLNTECGCQCGEFTCLCVVVPHRHAAMDPLVGDSVEVMEAKRAVQR